MIKTYDELMFRRRPIIQMSIRSKHVRDGGVGFVVVDDRFSTSDVMIFEHVVRAQSFAIRMTLSINCLFSKSSMKSWYMTICCLKGVQCVLDRICWYV